MKTPPNDQAPREGELILYRATNDAVRVEVLYESDTFWLDQKKIAQLFGVDVRTVSYHLKEIYATGELTPEATLRKIWRAQTEGRSEVRREIEYYNLDAIISVGYRVNSAQATQFRTWATQTLREFVIKGFVLDDERLKLNTRFGTDFTQADQLFFDQIVAAAVGDDGLKQTAAVNPEDKFELVFKNLLEKLFVERMDQNEEIFVRFMNDPSFQKVVTGWMAAEAYRRLRASGMEHAAAEPGIGGVAGRRPRLRIVEPRPEDRYKTCVPLVTLKAAAGAFSEAQEVEEHAESWVAVETSHRPRPGMFVAQVVGKSMEPRIPDGAWCLFAGPVEGTRQGRIVLVQHRDIHDPDNDARFTVKRYESEKVADGEGSWRHSVIRLLPINPSYQPIVLKDLAEGEISVIAELVEVLGTEEPTHG